METTTQPTPLVLRYQDFVDKPNLAAVVAEACQNCKGYVTGVIGPPVDDFLRSLGVPRHSGVDEYARLALSPAYGASVYVDDHDGTFATLDDHGELKWTSHSKLLLDVPPTYGDPVLQAMLGRLVREKILGRYDSGNIHWDRIRQPCEIVIDDIECNLDWDTMTITHPASDHDYSVGPQDSSSFTIFDRVFQVGQHDYETDRHITTCTAHFYETQD